MQGSVVLGVSLRVFTFQNMPLSVARKKRDFSIFATAFHNQTYLDLNTWKPDVRFCLRIRICTHMQPQNTFVSRIVLLVLVVSFSVMCILGSYLQRGRCRYNSSSTVHTFNGCFHPRPPRYRTGDQCLSTNRNISMPMDSRLNDRCSAVMKKIWFLVWITYVVCVIPLPGAYWKWGGPWGKRQFPQYCADLGCAQGEPGHCESLDCLR